VEVEEWREDGGQFRRKGNWASKIRGKQVAFRGGLPLAITVGWGFKPQKLVRG